MRGYEKVTALARWGFLRGILEVAVVDKRHAHDGNRNQMDRAVGRLAGTADDPGRLHVVDGIAAQERDAALLEPGHHRGGQSTPFPRLGPRPLRAPHPPPAR